MKDLAVIVPTYKEWNQLDKNEQAALKNTVKVLRKRDVYLIYPAGLNLEGYEDFELKSKVNKFYMDSYEGYNLLMTAPLFYQAFEQIYRYLAVVQPDVWIFKDKFDFFIKKFDEKGYDYIGAPWYGVGFAEDGEVGNGGFCMRRLQRFRELCERFRVDSGNEDMVFLKALKEQFNVTLNVAPEKLALKFSFEEQPAHAFELNKGHLPMGTHAYAKRPERIEFWKDKIEIFQ